MNEKKKREPLGATAKRVIAISVSAVLVLATLVSLLVVRHVRNNRPPALDTIRERITLLVEASRDIARTMYARRYNGR